VLNLPVHWYLFPFRQIGEWGAAFGLDATIAVADPAWDEIMLLLGSPSPEAKSP